MMSKQGTEMNVQAEITKINQSNMTPTQKDVAMSDLKLRAYNAWLLDPKRVSGTTYPGFPEDLAAPVAKRTVKVTDKVAKKGKVVAKKGAKRSGETKLSKAKALFQANGSMGRDFMIALFMTELSMTKSGATTYFYNAQK